MGERHERIAVGPVQAADREWARAFLLREAGATRFVSRGRLHDAEELPGLCATLDGVREALLTYRIADGEMEVITLHARVRRQGLGGRLLARARVLAERNGCRRLWLITTNDNEPAIRFYRSQGMTEVAVHRGAVREARRIKPEIPLLGTGGVPIVDEIEFELSTATHGDHFSIARLEPDEAPACEAILRSLPDWFGIESALVQYARDAASMETYVARAAGRALAEVGAGSALARPIIGFLTLKSHNPLSVEIQVMAVHPGHHRRGVGRALVLHAEAILRERGTCLLQVKTLGPSRPSEHYERTRRFYESMGFLHLEENHLWGDVNPCLILVKAL